MTIALVHGWGMHSGLWGTWPDTLPGAIALDLPGHGRRPREERLLSLGDVADDLVTALGQPAVWIGWSLGGLVALRAALDYPDAVRGLVLICASARFVAGDDWPHAIPLAVFEDFAAGLEADFRATLDRFTALEVHGSATARSDLAEIRRRVHALEPPARQTLRDGLELLAASDLRSELPGVRVPTLLIAGSRDRLVPARAVAATAARVPKAQTALLRGAGHAPFLRHGEALTAHVRAFLDTARP